MSDSTITTAVPRQIPVAKPSLGPAEADAARDAVLSGWISSGPKVAEVEAEFAAAHGKLHGVAVNSGTNALMLALAAAGIRNESRVVLPTLQFVAVANACLYLGATPVFVDSEPHTGNPDHTWPLRALCHRPDAVIAPGLYGVPAAKFIASCRERWPDTPIIEDLCQCQYATPVSGDFLVFSFFANKIVAGGEGGIILTDDSAAAERMRSLRSHAVSPGHRFRHDGLGWNFRWTDLQAAVALAQHRRRHELLMARERVSRRYRAALEDHPALALMSDVPGAARWTMPVLCLNGWTRDKLMADLAEAGIETRPFFEPLHKQPHLREFSAGWYPAAERLSQCGLCLPLFADITDEEVDCVVDAVRKNLHD